MDKSVFNEFIKLSGINEAPEFDVKMETYVRDFIATNKDKTNDELFQALAIKMHKDGMYDPEINAKVLTKLKDIISIDDPNKTEFKFDPDKKDVPTEKKSINEAVTEKGKATIAKWIGELGIRQAAIKLVDAMLMKRIGLSSADLPDTATFANGVDGVEDFLKDGDYDSAITVAKDTAIEMLEDEGMEMEESAVKEDDVPTDDEPTVNDEPEPLQTFDTDWGQVGIFQNVNGSFSALFRAAFQMKDHPEGKYDEWNEFGGSVGFGTADFDTEREALQFVKAGLKLEKTDPEIWVKLYPVGLDRYTIYPSSVDVEETAHNVMRGQAGDRLIIGYKPKGSNFTKTSHYANKEEFFDAVKRNKDEIEWYQVNKGEKVYPEVKEEGLTDRTNDVLLAGKDYVLGQLRSWAETFGGNGFDDDDDEEEGGREILALADRLESGTATEGDMDEIMFQLGQMFDDFEVDLEDRCESEDEKAFFKRLFGTVNEDEYYDKIVKHPEIKLDSDVELVGTHRIGTLEFGVDELLDVLGKPNLGASGDGKVKAEWTGTINGKVFTIYQYKDNPEFSIGGKDSEVADQINAYFASKLGGVVKEDDKVNEIDADADAIVNVMRKFNKDDDENDDTDKDDIDRYGRKKKFMGDYEDSLYEDKDKLVEKIKGLIGNTWFDFESVDEDEISDEISLSTRENGDVGEEEAGQADIDEAKRIIKILKDNGFQCNGSVVDEWVQIDIDIPKDKNEEDEEQDDIDSNQSDFNLVDPAKGRPAQMICRKCNAQFDSGKICPKCGSDKDQDYMWSEQGEQGYSSDDDILAKAQEQFPDMWIKPGVEFGGNENAVLWSGEGSEINGIPAFDMNGEMDYMMRDAAAEFGFDASKMKSSYEMGVHKDLVKFADEHGLFWEPYDSGTFLAYRDTNEDKVEEADYIERDGTFKIRDNDGKIWELIEFDGEEWGVNKIDPTHFAMTRKNGIESGGRPAIYHIGQIRDMRKDFYDELVKWLNDEEMIGGKKFNKVDEDPLLSGPLSKEKMYSALDNMGKPIMAIQAKSPKEAEKGMEDDMVKNPEFQDKLFKWKQNKKQMDVQTESDDELECDVCQKMTKRKNIRTIQAYGMDTLACPACRGGEDEEDEVKNEKKSSNPSYNIADEFNKLSGIKKDDDELIEGDTDLTVAKTILQQLGGGGRLKAMIGASNFGGDENSLMFKIPQIKGIMYIKITLNAMDLYDIEFMDRVGQVKDSIEGIYNDQLKGAIETKTGLYLSL